MMAIEEKLLDVGFRQKIITEIKGDENRTRMEGSLQDTDIYSGNLKPYVEKDLLDKYESTTVSEMPIVASINICKKIVDQRGSLYKEAPTRDFIDLSDTQLNSIENIYKDMMVDSKMLLSNRLFELQQKQTHIMALPKDGKLHLRTIKSHQINIVSGNNPEIAEIYIISSFCKEDSSLKVQTSDNMNQVIGDEDDYKQSNDRHIVWSNSYHFIMDGNGNILPNANGEVMTDNPIAPIIPIIEIVGDKDFEYWKEGGSDLSRFTVEYNSSMSDLGQIVHMQGFAQAFLKAPENLQPPMNMRIGPTYILRLLTDPLGEGDVEFGFANPGSDLAGSQNYVESLLSQFLSSQGVDPKTITGNASASQTFSSGIERLLEMVTRFEASKDSMAVFEKGERDLYSVIVAWYNILRDTDQIDSKYIAEPISEDATLSVKFNRPEANISDDEKLAVIEKKMDLGLYSRVDAIQELENKSPEQALERIKEIDESDISIKEDAELPILDMEGDDEEAGGPRFIKSNGSQTDD